MKQDSVMISAKAVISVPFYNESQFLKETLNCLRRIPEDTDVKFFLCNNQSTDGSTDIAQEFIETDKRFVLYTQSENIGAIRNFQFALENSDSDYFMWLGAHDLIDPSYALAALKAFEDNPGISYAAAEPYSFDSTPLQNELIEKGVYRNFHADRLVRYVQSVARLGNCTIVYSMFRRSYASDFIFKKRVISWDHIFISHLLWSGAIYYTAGHKYYRRRLEDHAQVRKEKILGEKEKQRKLPRSDFIDLYVEDFEQLYQGPERTKIHIRNKILDILEKRFGLAAFNYSD